MAKHSWERARWKRREAQKRLAIGGRWVGFLWPSLPHNEDDWRRSSSCVQRRLECSVHRRMSEATRIKRRGWRRAGREICRLHALEKRDEADNLDPQPKRLGVMWDIW